MITHRILVPALGGLLLAACSGTATTGTDAPRAQGPDEATTPTGLLEITAGRPVESLPGEKRLRNVRQLTFGGENAEAYWSFDGTKLVYQHRNPPEVPADQIYVLDLRTGEQRLISTGKGRTTCSYFLRGDQQIVFASTHLAADEPPPAVSVINGRYVWPIFDTYEIFRINIDGTGLTRLTNSPGYDAEATVCPVTGRIVFTSMRDDDLELYSMEPDGSDVKRLTDRYGYDGGAFYSPDGTKIVQRSSFLASDEERKAYHDLLAQGYVMPTRMEITVLPRDGGEVRKVTDNGKANFAPFWHPDNRHLVFASNMDSADGRDFDIYMIREDGEELEHVTRNPTFDGFPMFSPDGRHLVFASNRFGASRGETNIFVAEWVD
ncbi:MAG: PD40 domain-containing protein [Planctomycetes bacterium]|nr:PD40 domain-containing protein [Planctomycetota bacterium]